MSIERALVIGAGSGVGKATAGALRAAGVDVLASGRERDATDPAEAAALLAEADPDLVVVAAGTAPRMVSIEEQSWESFSAPWNVDVKLAFEVGRAVLARPLRPGSTVVIVSSGAGLNPNGSPMSGGYAGAKRMQMFLAGYFQRAADVRELGRLVPTWANGQVAFGHYSWREGPNAFTRHAITVLSLRRTEIEQIAFFRGTNAFTGFDLPERIAP
jgi:NAD(P)-dependent dehydrogenase (short-subunit alcohol dehydrogenase family)